MPGLPQKATGSVSNHRASHMPNAHEARSGRRPGRPDVHYHPPLGQAVAVLENTPELGPPPDALSARRPAEVRHSGWDWLRGHGRLFFGARETVRRRCWPAPWSCAGPGRGDRCASSCAGGTHASSYAVGCWAGRCASLGLDSLGNIGTRHRKSSCFRQPEYSRQETGLPPPASEALFRTRRGRPSPITARKCVKNALSPWHAARARRYNPPRPRRAQPLPLGNPDRRFHNCGKCLWIMTSPSAERWL